MRNEASSKVTPLTVDTEASDDSTQPQKPMSPSKTRLEKWRRNSLKFLASLTSRKRRGIAQVAYEKRMEKRRERFIIPSQSKFRLIWDIVTTFWLLYVAIMIPLLLGFTIEVTGVLWVIERMVDVHFITDILFNFRTGYYPRGEMLEVMDPKRIAKQYISSWFTVDVLSSIPFDLIFSGFAGSQWTRASKLFKVFRILRLSKLLRLAKLSALVENMDHNFSVSRNGLKMTELFIGAIVLSHFSACGFYYISTSNCYLIGSDFFCPEKIAMIEVVNKSVGEKYLLAFYWSVTTLTTIGYGDIRPETSTERLVSIFIMLLGGGFYGYVIANLARHMSKLDINRQAYNEKMDIITSYMNCRMFPMELRKKVKAYYRHYLDQRTALDEKTILNELPTGLRNEVVVHLIHETVLKVKIFGDQDPQIISLLVTILKPVKCHATSVVITQDAIGHDMYIVLHGQLDLFVNGHIQRTLIDGDTFGELNALNIEKQYQYTVEARTLCNMYSLSRDDLLAVFDGDQQALFRMRTRAKKLNSVPGRLKSKISSIRWAMNAESEREPAAEQVVASCNYTMGCMDLMKDLSSILNKLKQQTLCTMCSERQRDVVFRACGHLTCCHECYVKLSNCPICGDAVEEYTTIVNITD